MSKPLIEKSKSSNVAIIVLNYNGYELTSECLKELSKINYQNYKIFLVDNCSSDEDEIEKLKRLSEYYDYLVEIKNRNRGFAGGMNYGMERANEKSNFDYLLCCSNDIIPHKDFLKNMINYLNENEKVGFAGPVQYRYNKELKKGKIYFAGATLSRWLYTPHHVVKIVNNPPTGYINGAIFILRKECYLQTGGFDLDYYSWYEDCDLSIRSRKLGWELAVITNSYVWHKVAQTVGKKDFDYILHSFYYHARNKALLIKKNGTGLQKFIFYINFFVIKIPYGFTRPLIPKFIILFYRKTMFVIKDRKNWYLIEFEKMKGVFDAIFLNKTKLHELKTIPDGKNKRKK